MPFTFIGESPRTKSKYDLRLQRASDVGAMQRTRVQEVGAIRRETASKYAAALVEQDKRDYEMAQTTWKNFSNATGKQQEEMRQKTEAYTSLKKLFKRQGLEVFDDKGEIIFPPSKADADASVRASVEDLKEKQRQGRKPNPQCDICIRLDFCSL